MSEQERVRIENSCSWKASEWIRGRFGMCLNYDTYTNFKSLILMHAENFLTKKSYNEALKPNTLTSNF